MRRVYFCVKNTHDFCAHLQPLLDIAVLVDRAEKNNYLPSSLHVLFSCVLKTLVCFLKFYLSKNNLKNDTAQGCVNCDTQLYFMNLQLT